MNYRYNVNAYFDNAETTLKTNNPNIAIKQFIDCVEDDIHCDIVDGFTGEILAIANAPDHEPYATTEMWLMMKGYVAESKESDCGNYAPAIKVKICGLPS